MSKRLTTNEFIEKSISKHGDKYDYTLHGNPNIYNKYDMNKSCNKSFGELYQKTIKREEYLKSIGYKVISIWEDDFNKKTDFV